MKKGLDCADKFFFSCQSDVTSTRAVFDSVNAHGGNKTQSNTDRQTVVVVVVVIVVVVFLPFVCLFCRLLLSCCSAFSLKLPLFNTLVLLLCLSRCGVRDGCRTSQCVAGNKILEEKRRKKERA
jgi:hypothetical protein